MSGGMDDRPGVAYRRPDGDADRLIVESSSDPSLPIGGIDRSSWLAAVHPEDRDRLRSALDGDRKRVDVAYRLVGDGETWVHERGRVVDGGASGPQSVAFDDPAGSLDGSGVETGGPARNDVVGYLFPAGDRIERERELEIQRERLEEFARVVSHDLRNPLSVAVGNLELAVELDGDDAADRIERALSALDRMDDLIGDLLALAREGRTVEEPSETDLRTVVDRAWGTAGSEASGDIEVTDPLPRIACDRGRVRQLLENLFRNAIEHGPADPRIEVGTLADCDGFYVADDGPGIAPEAREHVFEPGHTTTQDGTGFGLAIVERIALAHGWSVEVTESRLGGARFEFGDVDVVEDDVETVGRQRGVRTDP